MTRSRPLRVLIAEDEPLARASLRQFFEQETDWQLIGEAADGASALQLVEQLQPDVLFLDIRMPAVNGVEVARQCHAQCAIVFTTAYEQHAITAFEIGVVDYLVKPFGQARFQACLARLRKQLQPAPAISEPASEHAYPRRLLVRDRGRQLPIAVTDILLLRADDDYVEIHTGLRRVLVTGTLRQFAEQLQPGPFQRVSRSLLVNLDQIESIRPAGRQLVIRFNNGSEVSSSRRGAAALRQALTQRGRC